MRPERAGSVEAVGHRLATSAPRALGCAAQPWAPFPTGAAGGLGLWPGQPCRRCSRPGFLCLFLGKLLLFLLPGGGWAPRLACRSLGHSLPPEGQVLQPPGQHCRCPPGPPLLQHPVSQAEPPKAACCLLLPPASGLWGGLRLGAQPCGPPRTHLPPCPFLLSLLLFFWILFPGMVKAEGATGQRNTVAAGSGAPAPQHAQGRALPECGAGVLVGEARSALVGEGTGSRQALGLGLGASRYKGSTCLWLFRLRCPIPQRTLAAPR